MLGVLLPLTPGPASAQVLPDERPGDRRPALPTFEPEARVPGTVLPPVVPRADEPPGRPAPDEVLFVREIRITGNTVLEPEQLEALTAAYENREVSYAELVALRDRITLEYVRRGYATSGAVLPNQTVHDGIVHIEIVEGRLTSVEIVTDGRYRPSYLEERIRTAAPGPVNTHVLEEQLRLLQAEANLTSLRATLEPGELPGESVLRLEITEGRPFRFDTTLSNHQSPSIGADNARFQVRHENLRGVGDEIYGELRASEGLELYEAHYRWPVAPRWSLELRAQRAHSEVVESPFDTLDIESRSSTVGWTLRRSLHRTPRRSLDLFVTAEHRWSDSSLLGLPFSFDPGAEDGEIRLSVLRVGQEWMRASPRQVWAARSTVSAGLDVLDATMHDADLPDGRYVAWLGQLQWARRVGERGLQIGARLDAQLANDALLGLEQFAVGGSGTVRGYREYVLVRDNGFVASLEARIPLLHSNVGAPRLELACFVDTGRSWNDGERDDADSLTGAGLGLRWAIGRRVGMEIQWAKAFDDVPSSSDHDLQDDGFHYMLWSHL